MELASLLKNSLPLLLILLTSAQVQPSPVVSHQTNTTNKVQNTLIGQTLMNAELKQATAHHVQASRAPMAAPSNDIMIVDPKEMAKDWKQAFTTLKKKQNHGLIFKLANGEKVKDISEIDTLPGGYLMIFTVKNLHGLQYKIIKTSEILSLETE